MIGGDFNAGLKTRLPWVGHQMFHGPRGSHRHLAARRRVLEELLCELGLRASNTFAPEGLFDHLVGPAQPQWLTEPWTFEGSEPTKAGDIPHSQIDFLCCSLDMAGSSAPVHERLFPQQDHCMVVGDFQLEQPLRLPARSYSNKGW